MNNSKISDFISNKYKSGISNAFILTGNIGDYVVNTMFLREYLGYFLSKQMGFDNIIYYDVENNGKSVINRLGGNEHPTYKWKEVVNKIANPDAEEKSVIVFYYPQFLIPAGDRLYPEERDAIVSLHLAMSSTKFFTSSNMVIFVTDSLSDINPLFLGNNSNTSVFDIELPNLEERTDFISYFFTDTRRDSRTLNSIQNMKKELTASQFANLTAGLQLKAIEDILFLAAQKGSLTAELVLDRKKEVIKKEFGEVVEIFDTQGCTLDNFAGQEHIKQYFKECVIDAIKTNDIDIIPKGIMLMGPPGTGKTYFCKCLAGDAGINFIEFKMSKILGKYVGESEKSMEKALSVFRALAPVGVFMDEIDQTLSRGKGGQDGASSVNSNIFGMFLAEMSKPENRGKIIWLGATNYPNNVDEALKRAGRFDKKIPFFAPTEEERESVFKYHLKNTDLKLDDNIDIKPLVSSTEGYTQAEIEGVVVKALELCKRAKQKTITQDKLLLALEYMISAQNDKIKEMEDISLLECNDQEFIPEKYKEKHRKLLRETKETKPLDLTESSRGQR